MLRGRDLAAPAPRTRPLVRRRDADREVPVSGARLIAPIDPATTALRVGESFGVLRAGDPITIRRRARAHRGGDPFRESAGPLVGADPVIAPYGCHTYLSDLALCAVASDRGVSRDPRRYRGSRTRRTRGLAAVTLLRPLLPLRVRTEPLPTEPQTGPWWDSPFVLALAGTIAIHLLVGTFGDAVVVLNPLTPRAAGPRRTSSSSTSRCRR